MNAHAYLNEPEPAQSTLWWRDPWRWLLLAAPLAAVVAGFITMGIAIYGADPVVDDNTYQKGIALSKSAPATSMAPAQRARNHAAAPQGSLQLGASPNERAR
jgi:uncharacterized protein